MVHDHSFPFDEDMQAPVAEASAGGCEIA